MNLSFSSFHATVEKGVMYSLNQNTRFMLSQSDIEFIQKTLSSKTNANVLKNLILDPDFFDAILDQPVLFQATLNAPEPLLISQNLYFYIVIRHHLLSNNIDNIRLTHFITTILVEASIIQGANTHYPLFYAIDCMECIAQIKDPNRFF